MFDHVLHDPIFFYAIAYVLFLVIAWIFLRKPGLQWIDGEIAKIREELNHARSLRTEAEAGLAAAKTKKSAALAEAEAIVKHAKEEAATMKVDAEAKLKYVLARHEQHAMQRLHAAEGEAIAAVRGAIVDKAMSSVRKALADNLDQSGIAKLADQAITDMPRFDVDNAKAA